MRPVTVLTLVLALLAGCGGFVASSDEPTVTPAPVPTDEAGLPVGVSETVVVPTEVTTRHEQALSTTNYTLVSTRRIVGPNGTVLRTTDETRRVASERRRYAGQFRRTESNGTTMEPTKSVDYWVNESVILVRTQQGGGSVAVFQWPRNGSGPVWDLTGSHQLEATLRAVDAEPREMTDDGVVLAGTDTGDRTALWMPPALSNPTNVSVRMQVRRDGVVTTQHVEYDASLSDTRVHVRQVTRIAAIGNTTVLTPAWVDRVDSER